MALISKTAWDQMSPEQKNTLMHEVARRRGAYTPSWTGLVPRGLSRATGMKKSLWRRLWTGIWGIMSWPWT